MSPEADPGRAPLPLAAREVSYPYQASPSLQELEIKLNNHQLQRTRLIQPQEEQGDVLRTIETWEEDEDGQYRLVGYEVTHARHVLVETDRPEFLIEEHLAPIGLRVKRQLPHSVLWILETVENDVEALPQAMTNLAKLLPENSLIEADNIAFPLLTPNDARLNEMWAIPKIKAEQAWEITIGDPDVVVAVMDTGFLITHEDLQDALWVNAGEIAGNGVDDDKNGYIDDIYGWDVQDDTGTIANGSHGTSVGGVIAASGNNEVGVAGVGWGHKMMVFRVGTSLSTSESVEALDYAAHMKRVYGVNVVSHNVSFGSLYTNSSFTGNTVRRSAIARSREEGILTVMSAGNDGKELEGTSDLDGNGTWHNHFPSGQSVKDYPNSGDWESVLSVAASTETDARASYSNYGVDLGGGEMIVDLAAPGHKILSTESGGNNRYNTSNGTSIASPHVTGAAGVIASANRSLGGRNIREILMSAGSDTSATAWNSITQSGGRLDLYEAVLEAQRYPEVQLSNIADHHFLPSGESITLEAAATDSDGSVVSVSFYDRNGHTLIGTDSNGSDGWSYPWTPADGTYHLYATATDNDGHTTVPDVGVRFFSVGSLTLDNRDGSGLTENATRWTFATGSSGFSEGAYQGDASYFFTGSWSAEFVYLFTAPVTGTYDLEFHTSTYTGNPTSLPILITHDGGTDTLVINASALGGTEGGKFHSIGSGYTFTAGQRYQVLLDVKNSTGGDVMTVADAIRLKPVNVDSSDQVVRITASDATALDDGSDSAFFTLSRSSDSGVLDVNLAITGTATAGIDYTAIGSTVRFENGVTSIPLVVTPLADTQLEDTETLIVEITPHAAYVVSGEAAEIWIEDANDGGTVGFASTSQTVVEDAGTVSLTLQRRDHADGEISVRVQSGTGSATAGSDYTALNQVVTWADQDNADKTVFLSIIDDTDIEATETLQIVLTSLSGGVHLDAASHLVDLLIEDNEINPSGTVTLLSPADGSDHVLGGSFTITAEATDPQGVQRVEFYDGATKLGEDLTAPYSLEVSQLWSPSLTLKARAVDTIGAGTDSTPHTVSMTAGPLPPVWSSEDVGSVGAVGTVSFDLNSTRYHVRGSGQNINGTNDEFHFLHQPFSGDGELVARILAYQYPHTDAQIGIMLRESTNNNSAFAMVNLRRNSGQDIEFTRRTIFTAAVERSDDGHNYDPLPIWAKLTRQANLFRAFYSEDGTSWTEIGSVSITMPTDIRAGLAVTARDDGNYAYGTFDQVSVTSDASPLRHANIPDAWEDTFFSGQDTPATVEKEGKDVNIYNVYVWGLDPTDSSEVLKGKQPRMSADGFEVDIDTVNGRAYKLERCLDLTEAPQIWTQIGDERSGDGEPYTFKDTTPAPNAVYRIQVRIP